MIKRILEISSGPARLSIAHQQLVIEREGEERATVPCEDVGVLLVDHPAVSYTHSVFTTLTAFGAAVVLCGRDHHPASLLLPLDANSVQSERFRAQLEAPLPLKKRLWQAIVQAKIRQQAAVLRAATGEDAALPLLARRVRSGDPENIEAQASQRYWPRLLGREFRRQRMGAPPNNLLNYGYMALRAATARALAAAGLLPTLGLHHHNRYNAFCLADDLMECYRPFVDLRVFSMVRDVPEPPLELARESKRMLLSIFNETIVAGDSRSPLLLALHATASSLNDSFTAGEPRLALPDGLFVCAAGASASGGEEKPDEAESPR